MSAPANVRSIHTIKDFRNRFATFAAESMMALEETEAEIQKVIDWLVSDRPAYWKAELRRAWDLVAEARGELERCMRNTVGDQRPSCYDEKKALEKAKRYTKHCEEKIEATRSWTRTVMHEVSEYGGRASSLRNLLETDIPRAMQVLHAMVVALEAYAALEAPTVGAQANVGAGTRAGSDKKAGSMARSASEGRESDEDLALWESLRGKTPSAEVREKAIGALPKLPPLPEEETPTPILPVAEEFAKQLGIKPIPPRPEEKVLLGQGALRGGAVYMQRLFMPEGDSGWYIGLIDDMGDQPNYEVTTVQALIEKRPALAKTLAFPPGFLVLATAPGGNQSSASNAPINDKITAIVSDLSRNLYTETQTTAPAAPQPQPAATAG